MLNREKGIVDSIIYEDRDIQELFVVIKNKKHKAMNFIPLAGRCEAQNRVLLNTTAIELNLGTGGYHYVISNLDDCENVEKKSGHIMKMRYTPLQIATQVMEEQDSPYHEIINNFQSLKGMPVIVGSLHSMLPPVVSVIKSYNPNIKITYIMSDGASLPMAFSKSVRGLKEKGLIDATITYGHAFGGDYEAVNIFTALIGAKEVTKCNIAVVMMGPGIVGTGTEYGFTGIEQGNIIDATNTLEGTSIAIPRISFTDKRQRHYGISHHSITTLKNIAKTPTTIGFPKLEDKSKMQKIEQQILEEQLKDRHAIAYKNVDDLEGILNYYNIKVSTMGRNYQQDPEFFKSAAVAGKIALEKLRGEGDLGEI